MAAINPWKIKAGSGDDSDFEIPPSGTTDAVLVAIIDLGTHTEAYKGEKPKPAHKLLLAFELVNEHAAGLNRNHIIGREFTLSLHPKAGLRMFIEAWRGNDFKEEEEFDITSLLGKSCTVNIKHKTSSNDRTFAVLDRAFKTRDTFKPSVKPVCWAIGDGEPPVENWLPPVFLDGKLSAPHLKIKASKELASKGNGRAAPDTEVIGDDDPYEDNVSDSAPADEVPW